MMPERPGGPGTGISDFIDRIYAAALSDVGWQDLIGRLGATINASWGVLLTQDVDTGKAQIHAADGLDRGSQLAYEQYYGPISTSWRQTRFVMPGQVYIDDMYSDYREYLKSETYNDFFSPRGGHHLLLTTLLRDGPDQTYVCFRRDKGFGSFDEVEIHWLTRLARHLSQGLRVARLIGAETQRATVFEEMLDLLSVGVVLVDGTGHVVYVNAAAEAIIARKNGFLLRRGAVAAAHPEDTKKLQALIGVALPTDRTQAPGTGGAMRLRRSSGLEDLEVLVVPLPRRGEVTPTGVPYGAPSIAIFLGEPSDHGRPLADFVGALYGLTPSEARLAAALVTLGSTKEASRKLGLAEQTSRGYLKQIYAKTGAKCQADLVRVVLSGPAGLML